MKKHGLDLQEDRDINIDGCHAIKAQHEEDFTIEADHAAALNENDIFSVWEAAHIQHYNYTRMDKFLAQIDYQEMRNYRDLDATEAFGIWEAEEARKLN